MRDEVKKVNIIGELALSTSHPSGCKFHPRCPYAMDVCKQKEPELKEVKPGHLRRVLAVLIRPSLRRTRLSR